MFYALTRALIDSVLGKKLRAHKAYSDLSPRKHLINTLLSTHCKRRAVAKIIINLIKYTFS